MSVEVMELFNIFSKTFSKEDAQTAVKDIEMLVSDHKRELATKSDLREVELKLTKEIEAVKLEVEKVRSEIGQAKSSIITWVVGWVAGLLIAYTGAMFTLFMLFKK